MRKYDIKIRTCEKALKQLEELLKNNNKINLTNKTLNKNGKS